LAGVFVGLPVNEILIHRRGIEVEPPTILACILSMDTCYRLHHLWISR